MAVGFVQFRYNSRRQFIRILAHFHRWGRCFAGVGGEILEPPHPTTHPHFRTEWRPDLFSSDKTFGANYSDFGPLPHAGPVFRRRSAGGWVGGNPGIPPHFRAQRRSDLFSSDRTSGSNLSGFWSISTGGAGVSPVIRRRCRWVGKILEFSYFRSQWRSDLFSSDRTFGANLSGFWPISADGAGVSPATCRRVGKILESPILESNGGRICSVPI